jgi:hypothetical protein
MNTPAIRPVTLRAALWAAGSLVVLIVGLYAAFWLPFRHPGNERTQMQEIRRLTQPDKPVVEPAPRQSYFWVDRKAGIVRIPIEEAMKSQIERLKVQEGAAKAALERERKVIATDAGSGRFVQRTDR